MALTFKYRIASFLISWLTGQLFKWWKRPAFTSKVINQSTLMISYQYGPDRYILRIPYSRKLSGQMTNHQVLAYYISEDREVLRIENITQQNGIPYLITPRMLGADYFIVKKGPSLEKQLKIESDDLIPLNYF